MPAPPSFLIRALLLGMALLQQLSSFGARADTLFQLVIYSDVGAAVEDAANATATDLMDALVSVEPEGFLPVEPGEEIPTRRRERKLRKLLISTCPPRCRKVTSPMCKVLGCVYCGGQTCQGRLRMLLDGGELAAVEADMSDALAPFCDSEPGPCEIAAEIVAVDDVELEGNTTVLP
jgi:hypothetical protein